MKTFAKLCFVIVLLANTYVVAQTTSVTLQVTDADSQTWNNGTWVVDLTSSPGTTLPIGGPIVWTVGGSPVPNQHITGTLGGGGGASMTLTQNAVIVPVGSIWNFNVCPQASSGCYNQQVTIAGASQTVTLHPPAIRIASPTPYTLAYTDTEIVNPPVAGQYYNLTNASQRQWSGTAWGNIGGSGGLPTGCSSSGSGILTCNVSMNVSGTGGGEVLGSTGNLPAGNSITAGQIGVFMGSNGVSGTALYGNYGGDGWAQFIRGDLTTGLIDGGQVNSNPAAGDANSLRNTYQGLADYVTCPGGFFNYDSSQAIGSRWSCSGLQPNAVSTTPYTVQTTDKFNILADTNSVASTWNLPAPSGSFASIWGFGVDVSLAGAPLTISATGGGCGSCQINGVNTLILGLGDTAFIYASDTTHWKALVSYSSSGVTVAQ